MNVGSASFLSDNLTSWDVQRATTDKLQDVLDGYDEPWTVWQVTHTGGRDWVVIATAEWQSLEEKRGAYGETV